MNSPRENPFRHMGEWYWIDEFDQTHGPFKTQSLALTNLLQYLQPPMPWHSAAKFVFMLVAFIAFAIWFVFFR